MLRLQVSFSTIQGSIASLQKRPFCCSRYFTALPSPLFVTYIIGSVLVLLGRGFDH